LKFVDKKFTERNTWKYLEILGNTWKYLEILGNTWKYSDLEKEILVEIKLFLKNL